MNAMLKQRVLPLLLALAMVLSIVVAPSPVYSAESAESSTSYESQLPSASVAAASRAYTAAAAASRTAAAAAASTGETFDFRILFISDLHGSFSDYRYATLAQGAGLARVATAIEARRDENTLLIDIGDTIQGNATSVFHSTDWDNATLNDLNMYPVIAGMEYLDFDVWVMGNHEFNFGMDRLYKSYGKDESPTPTRSNDGSRGLTRGISGFNNLFSGAILGGNVFDANNDARVWDDFWVKQFEDGPNIAVIGMVHSDITSWDAGHVTAAGYRATTAAEETQKTIAYLQTAEAEAIYGEIDIFIAAEHISSGSGNNGAYGVINRNPEIDLFLGAHGHSATNNTSTGVRYMELAANAQSLGQVDVTATLLEDGSWAVVDRIGDVQFTAIDVRSTAADEDYLPLVQNAHEFARANTESVIGELTGGPLVETSTIVRGISAGGTNAFYGFDNALTHLMHDSFQYYANGWLVRDDPELAARYPEGVTLSASSPMNTSANKQPGPITRADVANLYTYDNNTLCVLELTGHQLKLLIEWGNRGKGTGISDNFFHTGSISGTYDNMMFDGLLYKVDTSQPAWSRVVDMRHMDGTPFDMDATYLLAANNHTTDSRFLAEGTNYPYSRLIALPDEQKAPNPDGGVYDLPVVHTRAAQEVLTVNGVDVNNAEGCTGVVGDYVERVLGGNLTNEFTPSWRFDSTDTPSSDWVLYTKAIEIVNADIGVNYNTASPANVRGSLNPVVQDLWDAYAESLDKVDNKDDYDAADWSAFESAMSAAGQMLLDSGTSAAPNADLSQSEADAAVQEVRTAAAALVGGAGGERVEINILSFNDFHGTVDNSASSSNPGMARFTAVAKQLLEDLPNSTLVAAGDNYQGSAISNYFLGEPVSDMMRELGVQYSALGNHDYDWGPEVISKFAEDAGIEFLAANVFLKGTDERPDYCQPYATLEIGGKRIGLVGWAHTSTPTLVAAKHVQDFEFRSNTDDNWFVDEVDQWREQENWDAVVALTHDSLRGSNLAGHIDAIILGHTHVTRTTTIDGIPAVEAYYNGRNIGNVKLEFEGDELVNVSVSTLGNNGVLGTSVVSPSTVVDEAMQETYEYYCNTVEPIFSEQVGVFGETIDNSSQMAAWANQLVYDFIQRETGDNDYVLLQNAGGWRSVAYGRTPDEPVDYWFLNTLMPFDNEIYLFQLKGEYLLNFLNRTRVTGSGSLGSSPVITGAHQENGVWYHSVSGEPIDPDVLYKVSMNDFMFTGGDSYGVVANDVQNPPLTQDYAVYDYETLIMGVPLREAMAQQLTYRMGNTGSNALVLAVDGRTVRQGDQFNVGVSLRDAAQSNTAIIKLDFDKDKFSYTSFAPADGVTVLNTLSEEAGTVSITMMVDDYDTQEYGSVLFTVNEDAVLEDELCAIEAEVQFVLRDEAGDKTIETVTSSGSVRTSGSEGSGGLDGEATLIDLSNVIDLFGLDDSMPEWNDDCVKYDMNGDGKINIEDIVTIARMIRVDRNTQDLLDALLDLAA